MDRITVWKGADGDWYVRRQGGNNEKVNTSEGYQNRTEAFNYIRKYQNPPFTIVLDEGGLKQLVDEYGVLTTSEDAVDEDLSEQQEVSHSDLP